MRPRGSQVSLPRRDWPRRSRRPRQYGTVRCPAVRFPRPASATLRGSRPAVLGTDARALAGTARPRARRVPRWRRSQGGGRGVQCVEHPSAPGNHTQRGWAPEPCGTKSLIGTLPASSRVSTRASTGRDGRSGAWARRASSTVMSASRRGLTAILRHELRGRPSRRHGAPRRAARRRRHARRGRSSRGRRWGRARRAGRGRGDPTPARSSRRRRDTRRRRSRARAR